MDKVTFSRRHFFALAAGTALFAEHREKQAMRTLSKRSKI